MIQLELSMMLQGQMPPVEEGMDHMAHMEQQNPDIVMGLPQLQQMLPQQQQQILQIVQQHMAMHEQAMQATTSAPASGGSQPAVDGRLIENDITSQVRSNAQKTQQAATADVATLTGQGGMGG